MLACPICESQSVNHAFDKGTYSYHRCNYCEVLFVHMSLSHEEVHKHYGEMYFESEGKERYGRYGYPSYRECYATLTDGFEKKLAFIRRYAKSGNLLDAGAAYGFFLKVAEPFFDGVGLDISPYAADAAKEEFNARVSVGDIEQTDFPNNRFDVVVMWDIIEHIIRPVTALKEVHRLLKPGGYLFVSTDDAGNWLPRLLGHRWWALGAPMHLCHFSKRGLEIACGLAGFEPPAFFPDPRHYTISEIIKHFGVSYQSSLLSGIGKAMDQTFLKKLAIHIARPEQFIAVIHKQV